MKHIMEIKSACKQCGWRSESGKDGVFDQEDSHFWETEHDQFRIEKYGQCPCGEAIPLNKAENFCSCGRDYDAFGTELAPIIALRKEGSTNYL